MFVYLGEKLTKEEAKGLMKELCEPEDDEGFMPFMRKCHLNYDNRWKILPGFVVIRIKQISELIIYYKKFIVT